MLSVSATIKKKAELIFYLVCMDTKPIGTVTHYYDKAGVAVVKFAGAVSVGDKIKIVKGDHEFEQEVSSMQIEHEQVSSAKKGSEVAIKVVEPTKEGAAIYRVE